MIIVILKLPISIFVKLQNNFFDRTISLTVLLVEIFNFITYENTTKILWINSHECQLQYTQMKVQCYCIIIYCYCIIFY